MGGLCTRMVVSHPDKVERASVRRSSRSSIVNRRNSKRKESLHHKLEHANRAKKCHSEVDNLDDEMMSNNPTGTSKPKHECKYEICLMVIKNLVEMINWCTLM